MNAIAMRVRIYFFITVNFILLSSELSLISGGKSTMKKSITKGSFPKAKRETPKGR